MLGLLGVGGSSSQSPSAAGTHTAAFCSTQSPCPSPGGCHVGLFLGRRVPLWRHESQQPKHTQVGCVGTCDSAGLMPGLLNAGQVKRPCLADTVFLETTGKADRGGALGFPAREPVAPSG